MMLFNDFFHQNNLKNKATNIIKTYEILKIKELDTKVEIYAKDRLLSTDIGIVNLHASKGTHWVRYTRENNFDSCGCVCPKKLSKLIRKRNEYCLYSEYKIRGLTIERGSYSAIYR